MNDLLTKVKQNLILEHSADDTLLQSFITAAVSYAESYQHIPENYYAENTMPATTEQAVIMLTFMRAETARRVAFSQTMYRRQHKCGTP